MNVVRRAGVRPGDRVAIVGFGYLGALIVQLLPPGLAEWIAVSRRPDSRTLAESFGASATYDFDCVPAAAWDSFPVVIEAAGVQQTLDYATWLTAFGGRLVIAGYHADGPRTVNMQSWNWKGIDVINAHERAPAAYVRALGGALSLVQARGLDLGRLQTHEWSLDEADQAFAAAETRPAGFIKSVVVP
jgi:threonine dehydrogenase-like Zn-dependent dehydrogenase